MYSKKAISPVVAVALLLVTAVVAVVGFQTWFNDYSSQLFTDTEQKSSSSVSSTGIDSFVNGELYFNNGGTSSITSNKIRVGDTECDVTQTISAGTSEIIACGGNYTSGEYEIVVYTDDEIYSKKFFSTNDFNIFQCLDNGTNGFHNGNGSSGNPYQICNCNQLQAMNASLGSDYALSSDIDCTETSTWNNGLGFLPIGVVSSFNGNLDGNDYAISYLTINNGSGEYVGLFGRTSNADIYNVQLENNFINGSQYVGNLVGSASNSRISNITVSDLILHSQSASAAGIVGYQSLTSINDSQVISSTIIGGGQNIGGIGGYVSASSLISGSYVSSTSVSSSSTRVGFLGGRVGSSTIVNSYAINSEIVSIGSSGLVGRLDTNAILNSSYLDNSLVNITAGSNVAGLVGNLIAGNIYNSYVKNSQIISSSSASGIAAGVFGTNNIINSYVYNTNISGTIVGGIIDADGGTTSINSSYWDNETVAFTGTDTTDSGFGANFSTSTLQTPTSNTGIYINWSTSIWNFGTASDYPSLIWE